MISLRNEIFALFFPTFGQLRVRGGSSFPFPPWERQRGIIHPIPPERGQWFPSSEHCPRHGGKNVLFRRLVRRLYRQTETHFEQSTWRNIHPKSSFFTSSKFFSLALGKKSKKKIVVKRQFGHEWYILRWVRCVARRVAALLPINHATPVDSKIALFSIRCPSSLSIRHNLPLARAMKVNVTFTLTLQFIFD